MSTATVDIAQDEAAAALTAGGEIAARSPLQLFWRRLRSDRVAMASAVVIVLLILVAIFAPLIVSVLGAHPPNQRNPSALDEFGTATGPNFAKHYYFGVDDLGRDVFSRVVYGARVSLLVAFVATAISMFLGVTFGIIAGYFRGWVDTLLSRSFDVILAFPYLLLGLGIGAACSFGNGCLGGLIKPGVGTVIFVIVFSTWVYIARIIRGQVLTLREREFVEASRSLGSSHPRIMFREILPNLVAPIIVYTTIFIPTNILFEAALSFLGVGIQPPTSSWGKMIQDASSQFDTAWWYMVFPGLALLITVLAFNLLGDGFSDALNPRSRR
ncbi:MAG TPA: ABC transporter permease [Solirubrobacteraceae bacterium]|nr:ABC transporter permease [Solirubrobacteraceae bacterium]